MEKITLDNGTRIVTERLPHVRSAAFGVWVGTGSRHETPALAGASHALEHMVFKGTETRTSQEIARHMDSIGGRLNAFTTKEFTCYYGRALDTHLTDALDLIFDISFNAKIDENDWQTERGVILEEIDMYKDTPDDLVSERLFKAVFHGSPLARPILGTPARLAGIASVDLRAYRDSEYRPCETVFSLAGCFTDEHIKYAAERLSFAAKPKRKKPREAAFVPSRVTKKKPIEQNHWCLAYKGLPSGHPDRRTLHIMSGILGDGMSSRLFRAVREEAGLCYDISSFSATHSDIGLVGIYTAMGRESERRALEMARDIIIDYADHGPAQDEVDRAREQAKSSLVMSMESTQSRMNHMGQSELLLGLTMSQDEMLERYDAVTRDGVHALAQKLLNPETLSFSAVGRVDKPEDYSDIL